MLLWQVVRDSMYSEWFVNVGFGDAELLIRFPKVRIWAPSDVVCALGARLTFMILTTQVIPSRMGSFN